MSCLKQGIFYRLLESISFFKFIPWVVKKKKNFSFGVKIFMLSKTPKIFSKYQKLGRCFSERLTLTLTF